MANIVAKNERYASLHFNYCPIPSINGKALILSKDAYDARFPTGKISKKSRDYEKTFICRRAVEARSSRYTEEFVWDEIYKGGEEGVKQLAEIIEREIPISSGKKGPKKSTRVELDFDEDEEEHTDNDALELDDSEEELKTPRKRRKTSGTSTPRKRRTPSKLLTPRNKKYV